MLSPALNAQALALEMKWREEDLKYREVEDERRAQDDARRAVDEKAEQLKASNRHSANILELTGSLIACRPLEGFQLLSQALP